MRITNQMMTNSMLSHMNQNKYNMSILESQYSTGKKILKPSDDPIIAVRALKLRTNLTEVSQYLEKNIPDAESWMEVTESSLKNINGIIQKMNTYCVQGSSDTLTAEDRTSILQNLKQLKEQIYQEGNSQYAGRYVFTGYKTDTPLIYTSDTSYSTTGAFSGYQIKQNFTGDDIGVYSTVVIPEDETKNTKMVQVNRIQLAYDNLHVTEEKDAAGNITLKSSLQKISYTAAGTTTEINVTKTLNSTDEGAYEPGENDVYVLADTGELIMGKNVAATLKDAKDISVKYERTEFKANELKPEHYFDCTFVGSDGTTINYEKKVQSIEYEVNFGQTLKINTEAKEAITQDIDRLVDDITTAVENVVKIENQITVIKQQLNNTNLSAAERSTLDAKLEKLDNALTLSKDVMQDSFESAITKTSAFGDKVNVAVADLGSRANRLTLTKTRLEDQQVELEDLKSINEDVDLVETVIRYKSAEAIYTSSLSAAASVIKTNLLNFL